MLQEELKRDLKRRIMEREMAIKGLVKVDSSRYFLNHLTNLLISLKFTANL